ncbi:hypothetical protein AVU38_gp129 [Ralstonia phage RSL2]|nr:hypothetical protein AVU38_gp129 [Ralstonia phage RSL2]
MQQQLSLACLRQNLKLTTTIGHEEGQALPYLQYTIGFNTNEPPVFHGQARSAQEQHYAMMFEFINGHMVNETFPPTVRTVQQEPENGSNTPVEVHISYWKRRLVVEHDITVRDPDPKASQTDGLHKAASSTVWVGYDTKQREIIRVHEGTFNANPDLVDRVQYMEVGPIGRVVVVIFKDTKILSEGQQGTFAEGLKTAQAGFAERGQSEASVDLSMSSGGGMAIMSGPMATLADTPVAHSSGAAASVSLDPSKLVLGTKTPIPEGSELQKAISRLAGINKKQPTIDIPKSIKLEQLVRSMGVIEHALVIRMAAGVGLKNPTMTSKLTQKQAAAFAEKFGFKVTLLGEGGATATTAKKPSKVSVPYKKAIVKKPAVKRLPRTKPQSND